MMHQSMKTEIKQVMVKSPTENKLSGKSKVFYEQNDYGQRGRWIKALGKIR